MVKLSIIVPTLNEAAHIEALLESIAAVDDCEKEIFIVDGGSTDGTKDKVLEIKAKNNQVHWVENPDRYVSHGFNRAFLQTSGSYVALVGAHAVYPKQYFSTCIAAIESGACEVSGGFLIHQGRGIMGAAIAVCMASEFGVGNTAFRTKRQKMYVDSVAFAVYDRQVFERVGLFDEALIRNQDDEFHYRLNAAGLRILMLPELETTYFVRASLSKLFQQYFQYGFYKPLVFKKVRKGIRARHLIPAAFVAYLMSLPVMVFWPWWGLPLGLYFGLVLFFSLSAKTSWPVRLAAMAVYSTLHIAYGWGFIRGLWHFKKS
jgi:glycosyltransferase involved in cell wall biosynthesis